MIPIFMYHQVAEVSKELDPLGLAVPPDQFEQQMSYLARHTYHCLTLAEALSYLRDGKRSLSKSFVITFDDGYQDLHSTGCPILEKYGFTATIFLVASRMGALANWVGQENRPSGLLLSWAEARDLATRGHILGSHTLSHPRLSPLDESAARNEIYGSRDLLQERLEMPVDYFAYPYSDSSARIEQMVESAGYAAACAGVIGRWSLFHLWRTPCLRTDTLQSFALKACGWTQREIALRESLPGRFLRSSVHTLRRWSRIHQRSQHLADRPTLAKQRRS